jgi:hypothetical protein
MFERLVSGLFAAVGGAIAGGTIGLTAGFLTQPPPDPNDFVDAQGIHVGVYAIFGAGIGVGVALLAAILWTVLDLYRERKLSMSRGLSDRGLEI